MTPKKLWGIITTIVLVSIISFSVLLVDGRNNPNNINISFGDNFISYIIDPGTSMDFNIFGVQNTKSIDSSINNLITNIEFNNPNINVVDFKVDAGEVYNNNKLFNIIVSLQVLTNDIEKADKIKIKFKNGDSKTFDFGYLVIKNNTGHHKQHIEPWKKYNVGYPSLLFDANIKNFSKDNISINKLYDLTEDISYQFDNAIHLKPNEVKQIRIDNFDKKNDIEKHDFMTITPILSYTINNKKYVYYMPGVIYGVLENDIEKIKKIIN